MIQDLLLNSEDTRWKAEGLRLARASTLAARALKISCGMAAEPQARLPIGIHPAGSRWPSRLTGTRRTAPDHGAQLAVVQTFHGPIQC
jgi:hypothetical protein